MDLTLDTYRIEELMLKRGIRTRLQLAELAGLAEGTVLSAMNAKRDPALETVSKLARALGCHPFDILRADGFPAPHTTAPAALPIPA